MDTSGNSSASSTTIRVPLVYENLRMLERECDLTPKDYDILIRFCGVYSPVAVPLVLISPPSHRMPTNRIITAGEPIPIVTAFFRLRHIRKVLLQGLSRKGEDICSLEENSLAAKREAKAMLSRNSEIDLDEAVPTWCKLFNTGESRLLLSHWKDQCGVFARILSALDEEGFDKIPTRNFAYV